MEELKNLLQKNLEYTIETYTLVKKIHRFIIWQQIFSVIKIVVIIVPIIIFCLYAVPFLKQSLGAYKQVLDTVGAGGVTEKSSSMDFLQDMMK